MPSNDLLIQAEGVRHAFGEGALRREILHGVSCRIHAREILIVTGPSGSGKTTFLTLIGALRAVQSGSVVLAGRELRGASSEALVEARRAVGFIFQQHHLLPALSARENVQMPLAVDRSLGFGEIRRRASHLLEAVGLGEHMEKRPAELSGGQRQRVAIARALVRRPGIILADEPTASLDSPTGREIVNLLESLARQESCAVILVTHDARILDVADRVVHLEDGHLEESDLRLERLWSSLGKLAGIVSGYLEAVRPGAPVAPSLEVRLGQFSTLAVEVQAQLAELGRCALAEANRKVAPVLQQLFGELACLGDAVGGVARWFADRGDGGAMPVFEAVEGVLLIFGEAVGHRNEEDLRTVETMAQSGGSFLERLGASGVTAHDRMDLMSRVAPVLFLVGAIAAKVRGV